MTDVDDDRWLVMIMTMLIDSRAIEAFVSFLKLNLDMDARDNIMEKGLRFIVEMFHFDEVSVAQFVKHNLILEY